MRLLAAAAVAAAAAADCPRPKQEVHAFYYLWYGVPEEDGKYLHWDHAVLPHWREAEQAKYTHLEDYTYEPPFFLHSPFYPALGPYSSKAPATLDAHFRMLAAAHVDAAVLSWTGRPDSDFVSDTQGVVTDRVVAAAARAARAHGVGAAIHLEPYHGRHPSTVREDLEYLVTNYGDLLHTMPKRPCGEDDHKLPVVYVYDAYHNSHDDWAKLLCPGGEFSVRGTPFDVVAIATLLEEGETTLVEGGCFDGFYTYFATDGFTFGSSSRNWPKLSVWAREKNLHFSPSVGPGYNDTRIRPWNNAATRARRDGGYYEQMFRKAAASGADLVSITSFNEWGEGTQIEPSALPHDAQDDAQVATHLAYKQGPDQYLEITRKFAARFKLTRDPAKDDEL